MRTIRVFMIASYLLTAYSAGIAIYFYPMFGLPVVVCLLACLAKKRNDLTAYGTARWATAADIPHMLRGNGLIIGHIAGKVSKWGGIMALFSSRLSAPQAVCRYLESCKRKPPRHLVRLTQAVHTAVFAPTGVGKGVSCAIPFLLTNPDSCVVVDLSGDLAKVTADARRRMGHKVVLLDPFKVVTQTPDTFNPMEFIDPDSDLAIDDCNDLASALVVRTGMEHEPQWNDNAEKLISTMASFLVHIRERVSLQGIKDIVSNNAHIEGATAAMKSSDAWDGILARKGGELEHFVDRERGSVLTTTNRHLRFLDTPAIKANTMMKSSFDPSELITGRMTIYLILPADRMRAQAALRRMWISSMLRVCVRNGAQEEKLVHYIIDEAASQGRFDAVNDAIDQSRKYGIRLQLYYQSLGQLKTCFPEDQGQTLLSNTTQVFFGVNDQQTAEYVSMRLGEETSVVEDWNTGTSESWSGGESGKPSYSKSKGRSWKQYAKKLLKPEQVLALHERLAITFAPGLAPICTCLIRWYEGDFHDSRSVGLVRAAFEVACLFIGAAFVAALMTGALIKEMQWQSFLTW